MKQAGLQVGLEHNHTVVFHIGLERIELHDGASGAGGKFRPGQVPADGGMVAVDPDQRQQSRCHVDLAADSGHAPGFNRSPENDTWNVKAIHRHQLVAVDA